MIGLSGIGPEGFEPSFPDPKSGVLPLDEGPDDTKLHELMVNGGMAEWPIGRLADWGMGGLGEWGIAE